MPIKPFLLFLFCCLAAPNGVASPLRDHYSAYLAMHADDAVQWQLWGEDVLQRATEEKKLIFISSGYFTCHWCHVMQRESFQQDTIAGLLNSSVIAVKLDRELNPVLDTHLLNFVEKTRGVAGWPLNVFLTPQGHPLIGSGYLPPDEFLAAVKRLLVRWENDGAGLARMAAEAAENLESQLPVAPTLSRQQMVVLLQERFLESVFERADLLAGGFGDGAKFPNVPLLMALMHFSSDPEIESFLQLTLMQIADNGLRDHLGGGFFRYSVDPGWQQPHFEKTLYDNALLAMLYLDAGQHWGSEKWLAIGIETLDATLRDFSHLSGGYVSGISALDEQGREGGCYLWSEQQIKALLPIAEQRLFSRAWRLQGAEGWDGLLPLIAMGTQEISELLRMPLEEAQQWQAKIRHALWQQRNQCPLPRDDKRLAGCNGLLLSALARGLTLAEQRAGYRQAGDALKSYLFSLWDGEQLWRVRRADDEGLLAATLEDYAYVAQGLFDWAEATGDSKARNLAARLTGEAFYRYFRDGSWQASGESVSLLPSQRLLADGVLPSSAAVLALLGRRFAEASPLIPRQIHSILFADPHALLQAPFDYPGYITEIQQLEGRASRLSLETGPE